ncbi:unnamed protein product [Heterobilharzia americana]|nr:unnamed protein product [Heterobilharzia americana]
MHTCGCRFLRSLTILWNFIQLVTWFSILSLSYSINYYNTRFADCTSVNSFTTNALHERLHQPICWILWINYDISWLDSVRPCCCICGQNRTPPRNTKDHIFVKCIGLCLSKHCIMVPYQQIAISFCLIWLGAFGFAQYSLCLELAAEATYPISESVTTSLIIISSQIISLIMLPVLQFTAPLAGNSANIVSTCSPGETIQDFNVPNMSLCAFLVLVSIVQLFTLKLPYKRRNFLNSLIVTVESKDSVTSVSNNSDNNNDDDNV